MGRPWSNEAFITAVRSGSKLKQQGGNGRRPLGGRAHRHTPESAVQQASFPLIFLPLPVDFLPLLHLCTPTPELTVHTSCAPVPRAGCCIWRGCEWRGGLAREEAGRAQTGPPAHATPHSTASAVSLSVPPLCLWPCRPPPGVRRTWRPFPGSGGSLPSGQGSGSRLSVHHDVMHCLGTYPKSFWELIYN